MILPTISVIVPVYKVEKYLPECIESVLAQTFTDFELILVDDGSPDNSGKICDDYAKKDSRIRVFHKENGGVSSARNLGLDVARGEWIAFVDSDDVIDPDYYEILFSPIKNIHCPVAVGPMTMSYEYLFDDKKNRIHKMNHLLNIYEGKNLSVFFEENNFFLNGDGGCCMWLFHKKVKELRFLEKNAAYEDCLFVFRAVIVLGKIFCINDTTGRYHYLFRGGVSQSRSIHPYWNYMESGNIGLEIWKSFVEERAEKIPNSLIQQGMIAFSNIYLGGLSAMYNIAFKYSFDERCEFIKGCRKILKLYCNYLPKRGVKIILIRVFLLYCPFVHIIDILFWGAWRIKFFIKK